MFMEEIFNRVNIIETKVLAGKKIIADFLSETDKSHLKLIGNAKNLEKSKQT